MAGCLDERRQDPIAFALEGLPNIVLPVNIPGWSVLPVPRHAANAAPFARSIAGITNTGRDDRATTFSATLPKIT